MDTSAHDMRDEATVRAPTKQGYHFLRQSSTDIAVLVIVAIALVAFHARFGIPGLVATLPVAVFLLWPTAYGKRYFTLYENLVVSPWTRVVQQDGLWESPAATRQASRPVWWRRLLRKIEPRHPYPFRVDWLTARNGQEIGLVYSTFTNTYSILIGGRGSEISTLAYRDQLNHQASIADALQRLATAKIEAKASFLIRSRPDTSESVAREYDICVHPDVFVPKVLPLLYADPRRTSQELFESGEISLEDFQDYQIYQILFESAEFVGANGREADMLAIITLKRSKRLRQAAPKKRRQKPLDDVEASRQEIIRFANEFCDGLKRAGIVDPHIMDKDECEYVLERAHSAIDPPIGDVAGSNQDIPLFAPQHHIRMVGDDILDIDGTYHAVWKITGLPPRLLPNEMTHLFDAQQIKWMSFAEVSEGTSGNWEYTSVYVAENWLDSFRDMFAGVRRGAKSQQRQIGLEEREHQLADQKHVEYINIYLAVAADDPEAISDSGFILEERIRSIGAKYHRISGRARLNTYVHTATTGIPLL